MRTKIDIYDKNARIVNDAKSANTAKNKISKEFKKLQKNYNRCKKFKEIKKCKKNSEIANKAKDARNSKNSKIKSNRKMQKNLPGKQRI